MYVLHDFMIQNSQRLKIKLCTEQKLIKHEYLSQFTSYFISKNIKEAQCCSCMFCAGMQLKWQ